MSGARYASDANEALITMWRAACAGYDYPDHIDKQTYDTYKSTQDQSDPLTAFVGFGYSFGGKWFGGYADPQDPKQHLGNPKKTLAKKVANLNGVKFKHQTYTDINVSGCLIYCDPPYASTTSYSAVGQFDSERFWQTMREWSKTNTVVVSEYTAPDDFVCVWSKQTKTEIRTKDGRADRVEKLFMHESQVSK